MTLEVTDNQYGGLS